MATESKLSINHNDDNNNKRTFDDMLMEGDDHEDLPSAPSIYGVPLLYTKSPVVITTATSISAASWETPNKIRKLSMLPPISNIH
jgi:hypothetical protein